MFLRTLIFQQQFCVLLGMALPKDKLEPEVVVAGSQVEQEERVTGDTPPARLGCCPGVENDLLRASRVKFDTLSSGAATRLRMQTKPTSGCTAGSRRGSVGVPGRHVCCARLLALSGFVLACIISGR